MKIRLRHVAAATVLSLVCIGSHADINSSLNAMWTSSAGGAVTGQKEDGKNRIRWAIIGFICAVGAYLILDIALRILFGT